MTLRPARLRLRRRLLSYSAPMIIAALLTAAKLISVVVAGNSAVSAYADGDRADLRADAAILDVANVLEPAKAPYAAGAAAVLDGRLGEADTHFSAALAHTVPARSCPVRVNLELVRETQGDRAAATGDRARAEERYASALSVVEAAPPACFGGNSDPDLPRRAVRQETLNRLAGKRAALYTPPPAVPPPPPPALLPPPPPVVAVTPEGQQIPARRLDPTEGDPLEKLQQLLQDAAEAAPPGQSP